MEKFTTVQELIDYLTPYADRLLIVEDDGNTDMLSKSSVYVWDKNDSDSPIAITQQYI